MDWRFMCTDGITLLLHLAKKKCNARNSDINQMSTIARVDLTVGDDHCFTIFHAPLPCADITDWTGATLRDIPVARVGLERLKHPVYITRDAPLDARVIVTERLARPQTYRITSEWFAHVRGRAHDNVDVTITLGQAFAYPCGFVATVRSYGGDAAIELRALSVWCAPKPPFEPCVCISVVPRVPSHRFLSNLSPPC